MPTGPDALDAKAPSEAGRRKTPVLCAAELIP
jgi:hypothetical protein